GRRRAAAAIPSPLQLPLPRCETGTSVLSACRPPCRHEWVVKTIAKTRPWDRGASMAVQVDRSEGVSLRTTRSADYEDGAGLGRGPVRGGRPYSGVQWGVAEKSPSTKPIW